MKDCTCTHKLFNFKEDGYGIHAEGCPMKKPNDKDEEAIRIVKENKKALDLYWNQSKTWSRLELLEFIRTHVDIDTIT